VCQEEIILWDKEPFEAVQADNLSMAPFKLNGFISITGWVIY